MQVRSIEAKDIPRLRELHAAMDSTYELPDLLSDRFVAVEVILNDDGVIVMAICSRKTTENYVLMDSTWETPKWRWASFGLLHDRVIAKLKLAGYTDAHCWIEPQIARKFGKRLVRGLGWLRSAWVSYFLEF